MAAASAAGSMAAAAAAASAAGTGAAGAAGSAHATVVAGTEQALCCYLRRLQQLCAAKSLLSTPKPPLLHTWRCARIYTGSNSRSTHAQLKARAGPVMSAATEHNATTPTHQHLSSQKAHRRCIRQQFRQQEQRACGSPASYTAWLYRRTGASPTFGKKHNCKKPASSRLVTFAQTRVPALERC